MDCSPDVAGYQPETIASSYEELQERIARLSDVDPILSSHSLFHGDDATSSNLTKPSFIGQPVSDTDTNQSDSIGHARCCSDDCTNLQLSSLRLLETRDPNDLSQSPSEVKYGGHDSTTPWLPLYLRRSTSLLFLAIFALMIAILEVLLALSLRHSGLSGGTSSMRYLWSYGTTGILTLTAAFWHRLDYEEKVAIPWFKADPITSSKNALLLDYIDAWSLLVPFKAFRNRDYKVACSSMVSLLVQLLIVLSTALFVLTPMNSVNNTEPIMLTSQFIDDPRRLENSTSMLPFYIAMKTQIPTSLVDVKVIKDPQSAYPEGCTDQFAYQTFNPVSSELLEVEAVVDGLTMNLACEPASIGKKVRMPQIRYLLETNEVHFLEQISPSFQVDYQGCETTIGWGTFISVTPSDSYDPRINKTHHEHGMIIKGIPGFSRNQCNSTDKDSHRVVFLSAEVEWRTINPSITDYDGEPAIVLDIDATVLRGVALACTPSLQQIPLDISRNSAGIPKISPLSGEPVNSLKVIHPWDFIDIIFDENGSTVGGDNNYYVSGVKILADSYSLAALDLCGQPCQETQEFLDSGVLERVLAALLSSCVAATAHVLLRVPSNSTSTGTSFRTIERLWVQPIVCQGMVGVLSIQILLVLALRFEHRKKLAHRINPGSIAATIILAGYMACSKFPESLGSASTERLANWVNSFRESYDSTKSSPDSRFFLKGIIRRSRKGVRAMDCGTASHNIEFFDPVPLRPVSRIGLFLAIAGCSITLACLLMKSDDEQGLGEGVGSKYRFYAWTTVPATTLTVVSWWLSSIDIQVRQLAPYNSLKRKESGVGILRLNLLRGLVPSVLYWEVKTSNFAAVTTTIAALLGATLTTASAAMFHIIIYPVSKPMDLLPNTVFTRIPVHPIVMGDDYNSTALSEVATPGYMSSLILEANLSYSHQAYQDLVFPTFSIISDEIENVSHRANLSSATISLTVPALRPRLSCQMFAQEYMTAMFVSNYTRPDNPRLIPQSKPLSGIAVNITTEECMDDPFETYPTRTAFLETDGRSESFFGAAKSSRFGTNIVFGCSELLFIWGYHDSSPSLISNISAVACNSSVELVHSTISLVAEDMSLDQSTAPKAIDSTARQIQEYVPNDVLYDSLASLPMEGNTLLDTFFQQLVTSRYAIPIFAIGDPTKSQGVMDAIIFQHGVIQAQFLSTNYVMDINYPRIKENWTNLLIPSLFRNETSGEQLKYAALLTYPFGRHRIVQDPTATAILEVLLLSILMLSIIGWWLHPTKAVLPRTPTSVASVLALISGGNLLECLCDESPEPLCWEHLKSQLGPDSELYLGWDQSTSGEGSSERRFGIWLINKHSQKFCP